MLHLFLGVLGLGFFIVNTIFWCSLFYPFVVFKAIFPTEKMTNFIRKTLVFLAESWIACNTLFLKIMVPVKIHFKLPTDLKKRATYLVISNHRSWVDIIALQYVFNKKVPFFRFFIKDSLKWIPFIGVAWKFLDFPFMKRTKGSKDLETAKQACRKFKDIPASILIFLEGTRFSSEKRLKLKSKFKSLLPPKVGGATSVIDTLGDQMEYIIDVTIVYPQNSGTSFWSLLSGRLKDVWVDVREIQIPEKFRHGHLLQNPELKKEFDAWINQIWAQKDQIIETIRRTQMMEPVCL